MDKSRGPSPPDVTPAEWEVMKVIWEGKPMAARDVFAALPKGHGWAIKTVKTLLSRLVAKGALQYEEVGNSYLYRAACTRDEITREEVRGFVARVLEGSLQPVLAHFVEERDLSREEIQQLQDLLNKASEKGGKTK